MKIRPIHLEQLKQFNGTLNDSSHNLARAALQLRGAERLHEATLTAFEEAQRKYLAMVRDAALSSGLTLDDNEPVKLDLDLGTIERYNPGAPPALRAVPDGRKRKS